MAGLLIGSALVSHQPITPRAVRLAAIIEPRPGQPGGPGDSTHPKPGTPPTPPKPKAG